MLVPIEEHKGHFIVKFIHGVEVWHFRNVDNIEGNEIAEFVGNFHDDFVHYHTGRVPVMAPSNDNKLLRFC